MIEGSSGPEELPFLSELDTGPIFSDYPPPGSSESATSASILERKQAGGGAASSASENVIASDHTFTSPLSQDAKIQQLQALGFTRNEVELALSQADGEVNLAATLLLSSRQG